MREELSRLVLELREYRVRNSDLHKAHHFLFGLTDTPDEPQHDVVLLGVNPAEQSSNETVHPGPTEETILYNWLNRVSTKPFENWLKRANYYLQNEGHKLRVLQSELFFWSSRDRGAAFRANFGTSLEKSPHLEFCRQLNARLIQMANPRVVVVLGLTSSDALAARYQLSPLREVVNGSNGKALVRRYEAEGRPWLFMKHWTGGRGITLSDMHLMRELLWAEVR